MKNSFVSFLAGGVFFSILIFSTGFHSYDGKEHLQSSLLHVSKHVKNNRFYELRQKLHALEVDFAKFYGRNKRHAGNRLRDGLEELKYLTEDIQQEVFKMQQKKKGKVKLFGRK